jgi:hypothetical protein
MYPAALKKKSGHKYDILLLIDNDEVMIENIDHADIAFYRRTWIEEDHHTLDWKINADTDALEVRFEVRFFDHYDLLAKGGMMEIDDWKGNDDGKVEYYVNRAIMHKGMIIRAKPKVIRDSKYAQFTRQRRGTLDIDDLDDKSQDDYLDGSRSPPHQGLQRMPLQLLNGGTLLSTRWEESVSEEESENEMEDSKSKFRKQETVDVSDFPPKISRDIQRRGSLGNNVHWDTYEADGSIDVADDESSMTMSVCPVTRDTYLSYEESLSMPMRRGSETQISDVQKSSFAKGKSECDDFIPRPCSPDVPGSSDYENARRRTYDFIPHPLNPDVQESSFARRTRMRSYDHFFFQQNSDDMLNSSLARREKRRTYDNETGSRNARRRSYDIYMNNGVHVPNQQLLPSGEDTRKVDPSSHGEDSSLHSEELSCHSDDSKESKCLESMSLDVPGNLPNFFSARVTKPNRRKGIVDLSNFLADFKGEHHSTGTFITIFIIFAIFFAFLQFFTHGYKRPSLYVLRKCMLRNDFVISFIVIYFSKYLSKHHSHDHHHLQII